MHLHVWIERDYAVLEKRVVWDVPRRFPDTGLQT